MTVKYISKKAHYIQARYVDFSNSSHHVKYARSVVSKGPLNPDIIWISGKSFTINWTVLNFKLTFLFLMLRPMWRRKFRSIRFSFFLLTIIRRYLHEASCSSHLKGTLYQDFFCLFVCFLVLTQKIYTTHDSQEQVEGEFIFKLTSFCLNFTLFFLSLHVLDIVWCGLLSAN